MKLRNQIVIVNLSILGGLGIGYSQGALVSVILAAGMVLLLMVNIIFVLRKRMSRASTLGSQCLSLQRKPQMK